MFIKRICALIVMSCLIPTLVSKNVSICLADNNDESPVSKRIDDYSVDDYWRECDIDFYKDRFVVSNGDCRFYKFIPSTTRSYTITIERSGDEADPEVYVYDSSMTEIGYNDDYIDEDSRLVITLNVNPTYYIKSQMTIDFYADYLTLLIS